jgi:hypothetical protein
MRTTCDGTATIRLHAGVTSKDFYGGVCHSDGEVWSAAAGVAAGGKGAPGGYEREAVRRAGRAKITIDVTC